MNSSPFTSEIKKAKTLESRLENKIQRYSTLAQKINADLLCDEENPLIESTDEQELSGDIERDLNDLADCITNMRNCSSTSTLVSHQEVLIKRYHEIHFDYNAEFRNTSTAVSRKRESMNLFKSSNGKKSGGYEKEQDTAVQKLLKERNSIAASMKSINDVISQAFETRGTLGSQRASLTGASGGLAGIASNIPSFGRLIEGIQRKRYKESLVVALVVAVLICFTLWWLLR